MTPTPLFVGGMPGGMELAVIAGLGVLLFGSSKIPEVARSVGQAKGELQRGLRESEVGDVDAQADD